MNSTRPPHSPPSSSSWSGGEPRAAQRRTPPRAPPSNKRSLAIRFAPESGRPIYALMSARPQQLVPPRIIPRTGRCPLRSRVDLADRSSRRDRVRAGATRGIGGATARPASAGALVRRWSSRSIRLPTSRDEAQGAARHTLSDCCSSLRQLSPAADMRLFKRWAAMCCQVQTSGRGVVLVLVAMRRYVGLSAVRHNKIDRWIDQPCVRNLY